MKGGWRGVSWGEGALVAAAVVVVVAVVVGGSNQLLEKYCLSIPCQELVCVVAFFFLGQRSLGTAAPATHPPLSAGLIQQWGVQVVN